MRSRVHHRRSKGFTLIELLVVIMIMLILMALISTGVGMFINRAKILDTKNMFQTIHQAMMTYTSISGTLPEVPERQYLYRLGRALTEDILIYDYKNNLVRTEPPILRQAEIQYFIDEGKIRVDGGNYYFLDAWQQDILYFYGPIFDTGKAQHKHDSLLYEDGSVNVDGDKNKFNVRFGMNLFDLISWGPNKTSDSPSLVQYDDVTNFT